MEAIFMNAENIKTNELQQFVLNLPQRLDLRISKKYVALQNLSFLYTWKNISIIIQIIVIISGLYRIYNKNH